ncbi:MAG: hypothetical protein QJR05_14325, partial [Thermoanaerobacterium sp.]|nr:hypothetical protein [Thermoanaerobacterium sp.]
PLRWHELPTQTVIVITISPILFTNYFIINLLPGCLYWQKRFMMNMKQIFFFTEYDLIQK